VFHEWAWERVQAVMGLPLSMVLKTAMGKLRVAESHGFARRFRQ
jgi:hypothetical protein